MRRGRLQLSKALNLAGLKNKKKKAKKRKRNPKEVQPANSAKRVKLTDFNSINTQSDNEILNSENDNDTDNQSESSILQGIPTNGIEETNETIEDKINENEINEFEEKEIETDSKNSNNSNNFINYTNLNNIITPSTASKEQIHALNTQISNKYIHKKNVIKSKLQQNASAARKARIKKMEDDLRKENQNNKSKIKTPKSSHKKKNWSTMDKQEKIQSVKLKRVQIQKNLPLILNSKFYVPKDNAKWKQLEKQKKFQDIINSIKTSNILTMNRNLVSMYIIGLISSLMAPSSLQTEQCSRSLIRLILFVMPHTYFTSLDSLNRVVAPALKRISKITNGTSIEKLKINRNTWSYTKPTKFCIKIVSELFNFSIKHNNNNDDTQKDIKKFIKQFRLNSVTNMNDILSRQININFDDYLEIFERIYDNDNIPFTLKYDKINKEFKTVKVDESYLNSNETKIKQTSHKVKQLNDLNNNDVNNNDVNNNDVNNNDVNNNVINHNMQLNETNTEQYILNDLTDVADDIDSNNTQCKDKQSIINNLNQNFSSQQLIKSNNSSSLNKDLEHIDTDEYLVNDTAQLLLILGRHIMLIEIVLIPEQRLIAAKFTSSNVIASPHFENVSLFRIRYKKITNKIETVFLKIEGTSKLTLDSIIPFIVNERFVFLLYALDLKKCSNLFVLSSAVNRVSLKVPKRILQLRRKKNVLNQLLTNLHYIRECDIEEDLLVSFKTGRANSNLTPYLPLITAEFIRMIYQYEVCQKYISDGKLVTKNNPQAMNSAPIVCQSNCFSRIHGAFILVCFSNNDDDDDDNDDDDNDDDDNESILSQMELSIVWTEPNSKGKCQILNIEDLQFYTINIPESIERRHLFTP